jgi:hypothetical protein
MILRTSDFYESLPAKCCSICNEILEEMADCYSSTCTKCQGVTFYSLSPLASPEALPIIINKPLIK